MGRNCRRFSNEESPASFFVKPKSEGLSEPDDAEEFQGGLAFLSLNAELSSIRSKGESKPEERKSVRFHIP